MLMFKDIPANNSGMWRKVDQQKTNEERTESGNGKKTVVVKLLCIWFSAAVDGRDWACPTLLQQRSSPHATRFQKLPPGGMGTQCSTFAARAGRKREDAHRGATGDLEEHQKETSQMWVWPLHTFTTRNNADAKQKNLQAWNPMLAHLEEKCSTHVTTIGGGTAEGWQSPDMHRTAPNAHHPGPSPGDEPKCLQNFLDCDVKPGGAHGLCVHLRLGSELPYLKKQ